MWRGGAHKLERFAVGPVDNVVDPAAEWPKPALLLKLIRLGFLLAFWSKGSNKERDRERERKREGDKMRKREGDIERERERYRERGREREREGETSALKYLVSGPPISLDFPLWRDEP